MQLLTHRECVTYGKHARQTLKTRVIRAAGSLGTMRLESRIVGGREMDGDSRRPLLWWEALGYIIEELDDIKRKVKKLMATSEEVLAKVTANTDVLKSVAITADALNEGQESIAALIKELKEQVGESPELTELEAAVDEQTAVIAGMKTAIGENTAPA